MKLPKYDFVCSIGHYCATAMYLKRHHLRQMSGPLDWVGRGENGFETHLRLISTDFEGFLRKEALVVYRNQHLAGVDDMKHDYYLDSGTGMYVFHDFPSGVPLDESYPEVRRKYDRRIARFYATVKASKRTLFVYHTRDERLDVRTIVERMADVRRRFAGSNVDLLVIETVSGTDGFVMDELSPGIYHVKAGLFEHPDSRVLGNLALGDRIYSLIRCRGLWWNRLRPKILKPLIRFRVAFVFGREARREAFDRLKSQYGLKR